MMARRQAFFQEESSFVRLFRDAHDHCDGPQNPCEAIDRDGSSGRFVGCLEFRGAWEMQRVAAHANVH